MYNLFVLQQEQKIFSILRAYRTGKIGAISFKYLLNKYKNIDSVIDFLKDNHKSDLPSESAIYEEINCTLSSGANFLHYDDSRYPLYLKDLIDSPPILIYKGNVDILNKKLISVVGSRHASCNGLEFCRRICIELANLGYVTVSGLAIGIDTCVHKATLNSGTIGIIAQGIDQIYPQSNYILYEQMYEKGLILTDNPIGTRPIQHLFPKRNSIIAGISNLTVIIESNLGSGALITAQKANSYGRKVLAVPGHPYDEKYKGNNFILKNFGLILENVQDILKAENQNFFEDTLNFYFEDITKKEIDYIRELISSTPVHIDDLCRESNLPIGVILSVLAELELENQIIIHEDLTISKCYFH